MIDAIMLSGIPFQIWFISVKKSSLIIQFCLLASDEGYIATNYPECKAKGFT